jgi:hypothetical protein
VLSDAGIAARSVMILLSIPSIAAAEWRGGACPGDRVDREGRISIDQDFYTVLVSEGGGWETAADAYALID